MLDVAIRRARADRFPVSLPPAKLAPIPKPVIVITTETRKAWQPPTLTLTKPLIPMSTVSHIKRLVCARFNVSLHDMMSDRRTAQIVKARQMGMYLTRERTGHSWMEIARRFNRADHTSPLLACRKIARLRAQDTELDATIKELEAELQG